MHILYNGQLLAATDFALPLPNRGFQFNDGFFETMIWADGQLRYAADHLSRLTRAAAVLGLTLPPALSTGPALAATLRPLVEAHQLTVARLRLQVWRGGGGLYTPPTDAAGFVATAQPFVANDTPVARADFSQDVRTHFAPWSFCKGPNALTYVLAGRERQARALDEILLLDGAGHVAEAGAAAVFWITENRFFTPALTTGCVAGVRRAHLLRIAAARGVAVTEGLFQPADLLAAEAVFTANVAALRPVQTIGDVVLASEGHPLLAALREWEAG